jgi:hypothetical protein
MQLLLEPYFIRKEPDDEAFWATKKPVTRAGIFAFKHKGQKSFIERPPQRIELCFLVNDRLNILSNYKEAPSRNSPVGRCCGHSLMTEGSRFLAK